VHKYLQLFPEARFLLLPIESLLVKEEVLSREIGFTAEKGHNIWSDRWIELKALKLFTKAVFLEVPMVSLLVKEEVLSRQTEITTKKGHNFWSDYGIALKYLQ